MAQHYAPEEVSGAVLATQLAEDLVKKGLEVSFLTSAPSYPAGKVFKGFNNPLYKVQWQNGVRIIRTWSFITPSKSTLLRMLNQMTFSISCFFAGLINGKHDIIFSYSPPLPLGISASWLGSIKRIPWILRVEDLFPDTAIAGGVLRNKGMIRILHWVEKKIYKNATHISLISNAFKDILSKKGVDPKKLSVTPVWADPYEILPGEKENSFRKQLSLSGKYVILYSGNIGHTSALEDIIHVAENLKNDPNIYFLIVGEGIKKDQLESLAQKKDLRNLQFLPYQKRELVPHMLAAADLCLVTIDIEAADFSLPSKSFSYMASARPILAISPTNSEVAQLVRETKSGINVENGKVEEIISTIYFFYQNPQSGTEMGINGRHFLEVRYSREICVEQFWHIIQKYGV